MQMGHDITRRRALPPAIALLLLLAALAGISCGGYDGEITVITHDPTATAATTAATTPAATGTATIEPVGTAGGPFGDGPYSGGVEEVMVLNDIRFGDQEGYERVVVEFVGQAANPSDNLPRYTVTRGVPPYYDLDGNLVPLYGPAYIEIRANGNRADLSVEPYVEVYAGPGYVEPGLDLFYSLEFVPAYENNSIILLLDLADAYPFRVIELAAPSRIVVDIEG
ncbi:MAG: AMIN-like domain-containing (lipo)protein [Thermoleophilia bacterium]